MRMRACVFIYTCRNKRLNKSRQRQFKNKTQSSTSVQQCSTNSLLIGLNGCVIPGHPTPDVYLRNNPPSIWVSASCFLLSPRQLTQAPQPTINRSILVERVGGGEKKKQKERKIKMRCAASGAEQHAAGETSLISVDLIVAD